MRGEKAAAPLAADGARAMRLCNRRWCSDEQIALGILASGNIADKFVTDRQLTGHEVVAAGSRAADKAAAFAARFGLAHAYGSYEALVAAPEVDVVYVATPHPMHAAAARLAIDAGKHVLVEKPFALNAAEAADIMARAAARGVVVLEAMWMRFLPHMVKLRALRRRRHRHAADARRDAYAAPVGRPGAPPQRPGAGRRRAARPRRLPGVVRHRHAGRA